MEFHGNGDFGPKQFRPFFSLQRERRPFSDAQIGLPLNPQLRPLVIAIWHLMPKESHSICVSILDQVR